MRAASKFLSYNAITQAYTAVLSAEPQDGDVFIWSDRDGFQRQPPLRVLLPDGVTVTREHLPPPAYDPGLLAPVPSEDELFKQFPLIARVQNALRRREGTMNSDMSAVERAVFNAGVICMRECVNQLTRVSHLLHDQREAQRSFNHTYTQLTELVEQCPTPFA